MYKTINSKYLILDNIQIHYLDAGVGDVILLLHGWPTSSFLWRNVILPLAKTHRVIAMDLPGFGKSDKSLNSTYSFKFYYDIIDGFLEELGVKNVTLGVHDLGGPLGLLWAVRNMRRVDRLILLNTLVYPDFSWGVKLFGLATRFPFVKSWISGPNGIRWAMHFGVGTETHLSDRVIESYQAPFAEKNARMALLKTVQNLSPKGFVEITNKLPDYKGPVQIIYGERDRILPKVKNTMNRVKSDLPQAKIVTFSDCGHFIQEEVGKKIGEIISSFVNQ